MSDKLQFVDLPIAIRVRFPSLIDKLKFVGQFRSLYRPFVKAQS